MHSNKILHAIALALPLAIFGCSSNPFIPSNNTSTTGNTLPSNASLKQKYADHFLVGATADSGSYITHADILKTHFSSMTTENEIKFELLQNVEGEFTFETADKMVDFAKANGMTVRGHALVWHRQSPDWLFHNAEGEPSSKEDLLAKMNNHIATVVNHFKGRVDAWDVVNESIMDNGAFRTEKEQADDQKSWWYGITGEDYIAEAFKTAHQADPQAKLFYNDYYNYIPERRQAIYEMLKGLVEKGVPVHGVGLQCHVNTERSLNPAHQSYQQTIANLEQAIQLYASLGLEVHITEMDVSIYIGGNKYEEKDFYTAGNIPEELKVKQAERYAAFFEMFRRNSDAITSVTLWGIADDNTWLSEFDSGRADFPLLFDSEHKPKKAFDAIMDF
ncbi:endo-1,4-beta-xylanase [Teredinibacter haidensis]|uniref:endo-1,4-beta-xylanase n=1 Tax=Teredinibacter haidensis TaxID=2731755 RepID=UPI0009FB13BB|nr:endo-1,4-beta-xylanase [Teredinibacter haidensis]